MPACFTLFKDLAAPVVAVFPDVGRPLFVFGPGIVEVLDVESLEVNLPVESMTGSFVDLLENALTSGQQSKLYLDGLTPRLVIVWVFEVLTELDDDTAELVDIVE